MKVIKNCSEKVPRAIGRRKVGITQGSVASDKYPNTLTGTTNLIAS